jgi:hypothetical protein
MRGLGRDPNLIHSSEGKVLRASIQLDDTSTHPALLECYGLMRFFFFFAIYSKATRPNLSQGASHSLLRQPVCGHSR